MTVDDPAELDTALSEAFAVDGPALAEIEAGISTAIGAGNKIATANGSKIAALTGTVIATAIALIGSRTSMFPVKIRVASTAIFSAG